VYSAIFRRRLKCVVAKQPLPLITDLRIVRPCARFMRSHCTTDFPGFSEVQYLRLCRLMCGRSLTLRTNLEKGKRATPVRRGRSPKTRDSTLGRPEAFRTSGGEAAQADSLHRLWRDVAHFELMNAWPWTALLCKTDGSRLKLWAIAGKRHFRAEAQRLVDQLNALRP